MSKLLHTGKVDPQILDRAVLGYINFHRPEVIAGAEQGRDCAVLDFNPHIAVMSTDPITATVSEIGRLAVNITCNDIATNGIQPIGIMLVLMLPKGTTEADIAHIMKQAQQTAKELEVEIIGGHTEITEAVNKPVVVSTAIARGDKKNRQQEVKEGDVILLTASAGIEGTGIIACEKEEELSEFLTREELDRAKGFLKKTIVLDQGIAVGKIGFSMMHDVTEGGVLGAFYELCKLAGVGGCLENVPVDEVTAKICGYYDINALRLISSGAMLITARQYQAESIVKAIKNLGVECSKCGEVRNAKDGIIFQGREVAPPAADEIFKVV